MSEQRQERKVVTVLFCDLVGFTSRAEELDPEDVAALLAPYQARLKEELERYGGTVEKFIGDAVMALFGAPVAHEDDPERAVRAALAIREYAEEEGIELRIGITTGEALVTLGARPEEGQTLATGDVVNTAARLQAAAPVNGILVGEKTFEATKDAIEYRDLEPVDAKGKARPITVWEPLRARSRITLDRLHATPLVGRERELDLLAGAFARARAERQPQLVTLVGVPGIGKSRLVYELSQLVDRDPELVAWRQGRCLPYGEGVTFWALGEIVKAQLGVLETDPPELIEEKLAGATSDDWLRSQLRPLAGLGADGLGAGDRRDEAFTAWRGFLEGIARDRPLILIFEDLHWADGDLLDFVDHLVDWASGAPLLVVCTARPELLERRPGWGGGKANALTISLSPLTNDDTSRLIAGLAQRALFPAELHEALLARAGGNPLYAEQYVRMLEERTAGDLPLPETVQGIIAARLDVLEPEQKAALQDASVVGKAFWLGALTSLSTEDGQALAATLHALERKGFVRREPESSIEGDTEYAFLHVVLREVAYGQIPRGPRSEKHRQAAEWIEALGRHDDHAEMLAHHYGEALALGRAAGADTSALEEPARRALRDAGDRAMALYAYSPALRFYEQAVELSSDADPERPSLLLRCAKAYFFAADSARTDLFAEASEALLLANNREEAAEARTWEAIALSGSGSWTDAIERTSSAAALLAHAPSSPEKAFVAANHARCLVLAGRYEEARDAGRTALELAEELQLGEIEGNALNSIGMARMGLGDVSGIDDLEQSLRLAREHGSPFEMTRTMNNLGIYSQIAGRMEWGTQLFGARLELDRRFGLPGWFGEGVIAVNAYWTGRWEEAESRTDDFITGESEHPAWALVRGMRALLRLARDDVVGAEEDAARALELLTWDATLFTEAPTSCARVALELGRSADARELVEAVLTRVWGPPYGWGGVGELALLIQALGLPRAGVVDAADGYPDLPWLQAGAAVVRGDLADAADRLAALGCPPLESAVRLRLADELVAAGRRAEADTELARALAFWRSVGATRYIREAEALLAGTA